MSHRTDRVSLTTPAPARARGRRSGSGASNGQVQNPPGIGISPKRVFLPRRKVPSVPAIGHN